MSEISILDTSLSSDNIGDEIIMSSVNDFLIKTFPNSYIWRIPSHDKMSKRHLEFLKRSSICFIGGTNILSSNMLNNLLFPIDEYDAMALSEKETVCIGSGWNDYMVDPDEYSTNILKRALSKKIIHSVRDSYSKNKMDFMGIKSINTSCPTMWSLTKKHCKDIQTKKAKDVILTLTWWRKNESNDTKIISILKKNYRKVYFFPQMCNDIYYVKSLNISGIKIINPNLVFFDKILENEDVDFIGTRLHGGIRALQKKRRSLILTVDNRAEEIRKDTNIGAINRNEEMHRIQEWIDGDDPVNISIPRDSIEMWRRQFK